jgi:hypothetical protein
MDIVQVLTAYPWIMCLGAGLPVGIAIAIGLWRSWAKLGGWLQIARSRIFTRAGFFWSVMVAFMAVSVWQGGAFFSVTGDLVGYAVALFLDLVTIVLMHAQLESRYRGENGRANLFVFFISITCGVSTFGNMAMALNTFNASAMLPNAPTLVQTFAPFVLASSPLFVIMMSVASEMVINVRPLDKLDTRDYEADENKRVQILNIRNQYYTRQVDAELELQRIKSRRRVERVGGWFLRWPWVKSLDVNSVVSEAANKLDARFEALTQQNQQLSQQVRDLQQVDITGLVADMVNPLALTLSQLNQQVSNQLQGLQSQIKPLDTIALVQEITRQLDAVYSAKLEVLTRNNEELGMQLSLLMTEIQAFDDAGDTEELEPIVKTPYPVELARAIEGLLSDYPSLQAWLSTGRRSATIEDIMAATGHSRKMVVNRVNDHTIKRTRKAGKYRVDSVIAWLKIAPLPKSGRDTTGTLQAVKVAANGHGKQTVKLDQLGVV